MDLSEDSSNGNEGRSNHPESHRERNSDGKKRFGSTELERRTTDYHRDDKERNKYRERNRDNYKEERNRNRDKRKDYRSRKDPRREREDYRERDEHLHRDRERDREYKTSRVEKSYSNESSNFRDRYRRSVSPRNRKDRKRHQSRSRSRDRISFSRSSTDNSINSKVKDHEHKAISQSSTSSSPSSSKDTKVTSEECKSNSSSSLPSYYNPNVINPNKYAEQAQKRKLLWSNKKPDDNASKWGSAKFAQDTDGKVQSKFMRLMGIKSTPKAEEIEEPTGNNNSSESIKKREEMFSSMEQQYEVARQVTHTMRGFGLGFSSQSRQF